MSSLNCLSVNTGATRLILLAKVFFEVSIVYATSKDRDGGGGGGRGVAVVVEFVPTGNKDCGAEERGCMV